MNPSSTQASVTVSVLDRLLDSDPHNTSEAPLTRAQSVRMLKDAVRRDLEWLLNTRQIAVLPDGSLRELNRSVYMFGLPDFSAYALSAPDDRNKLLRAVQSVIRQFEPRLAGVRVLPVESPSQTTRTLRFHIEALLVMAPAPEHVAFDTVLQLASGQYEVQHA